MCGESQAATETRHQQQRARPDTAFFQRLAQSDRYSRRRHVAVAVDVDEHALHRHSRALGNGIDDAQIGLVRDEQVYLLRAHSELVERTVGRRDHSLNRALEDLLALELPARVSIQCRMVRVATAHPAYAQGLASIAIATQLLRQHAFFAIRRLQHHGGCAVAEQNGDVTIAPVHEWGDQLRADDESVANDAGANHRGSSGQSVGEARASRVDVHGSRGGGSDARLYAGRHVGHLIVVAARAEDDQLEVSAVQIGSG